MTARFAAAGAVVLTVLACVGAEARASAPLNLGIDDYGVTGSPTPATRDPALRLATSAGARIIRVTVDWSAVAPPESASGFHADDPAAPGYNWSAVDALLRSVAAAHARALLLIARAPQWAEGRGAPPGTPTGTWRPAPAAFGAFATAAARRYSGRFPDPLRPHHSLPRVRDWEAWNEPNLWLYLNPQWVRRGRHLATASPGIYRGLLNAFYRAVKSVSRHNLVIAGGTAPFGDLSPGGRRIPPVTFVRDLFCLRASGRRASRCGPRARFDVLDHHPFDIGGPRQHALNAGDVSVPDMAKLSRLLVAARRHHTVLPRGHKRLWATELAWSSRPPDRLGVPLRRQARWLEEALYVLWRSGVDTILWLQLVDDPPGGLDAGMLFRTGRAKPALTAFRFPFVAERRTRRAVSVWGRAPVGGRLLIELRRHRRWTTVRRLRIRRDRTFRLTIELRGHGLLRARVGHLTSLDWRQR